jgi:glycosyltransferase involved in cell wall biosynthesis
MPVLESMASGCPVVSSNSTVIPEVAGDAAVLVNDPSDPSKFGDSLIKVLSDKDYREEISKRGLSRASEFTWKRCAKQFLDLFDKIDDH